jgi:hypothetical protein
MSRRKTALPVAAEPPMTTDGLYTRVRGVLHQARQQSWCQVNHTMVRAYWNVGRLIVEHEQAGQARAAHGARLLQTRARRLGAETLSSTTSS